MNLYFLWEKVGRREKDAYSTAQLVLTRDPQTVPLKPVRFTATRFCLNQLIRSDVCPESNVVLYVVRFVCGGIRFHDSS